MTAPAAPSPNWLKRHWGLVMVVAVLSLMAFVRLHTRNFPLERDEGEYAYAGQLMLEHVPPYRLAYNMKFPGTYAAYALIMAVFGETPAGIHVGILCLSTLTVLMLYWMGRRLVDEWTGVGAAVASAFLFASPSMFGLAGHATHFAAFFIAAGLCFLWPGDRTVGGWKVFMAGLMFGFAVLMKQHAAIIGLWGGLLLLLSPGLPRMARLKLVSIYLAGLVLPFLLTCLVLWRTGVFHQFWFWTIDYAREYVTVTPFDKIGVMLKFGLVSAALSDWIIWMISGLGFFVVCFGQKFRKIRPTLGSFFFASFLTTCPGFYFRTHYFLVMVPALSLLAGCAVSAAGDWSRTKFRVMPACVLPAVMTIIMTVSELAVNSDVWFELDPVAAERVMYQTNPFPEAEVVSQFLNTNSRPTDMVAVIGSEPEIYFRSHRLSATGYIYTYPLMEPQPYARKMQEQMIQEIEHDEPRFVVSVDCQQSWLPHPDSDQTVLKWWNNSYQTNYTLVGLAEILSQEKSRYSWGEAARTNFANNQGDALLVYERNHP